MSGNVVRIGDAVSCGDHAGNGSPTVFADGMPISHEGNKNTIGHGCFPPTIFIGPWSTTVYVQGNGVTLKDVTRIRPHRCGKKTHDGVAIEGAPSVYIEK